MTRFAPWKVSLTLVCLVVGLLVLSNTMSFSQAPESRVAAWEYKTVFGSATLANDDQLNELGSKGWTLDVVVEEPGCVRFVFKRSKGFGRRGDN